MKPNEYTFNWLFEPRNPNKEDISIQPLCHFFTCSVEFDCTNGHQCAQDFRCDGTFNCTTVGCIDLGISLDMTRRLE